MATPEADAIGAEPAGRAIDIGEYLHLLKSRWPLIAAVCVVTTVIGLVHFLITPKLYRAETVFRIRQQSLLPIQSDANPWLEAWASMKYYPTQYRLLQSRGLAERVVRRLRLAEDPALQQDSPPVVSANDALAASEVDDLFIAGLASRILGGLSVDPIENTELIRLAYVSERPEQAARIANAFVDAYIDWEIDSRSESLDDASTFMNEQIETLRGEIASKERLLRQTSRDTDFVSLDPEAPASNLTQQRLASLNLSYTSAIANRLEKEARYNELRSAPREVVADRESGGLVSELRKEQIRLEREYETKLQIYKPDWPEMVELQSRIDEGKAHLEKVVAEQADEALRSAQADYQTAMRSERSYLEEIRKVKSEAFDQTSTAASMGNLQTEIEIRRELLDQLLRRLSEAGISASLSSSRQTNIEVVDRALLPTSPFRPSLRNDLSLGLLAGLALGIGLVLLIHFLDRTVKTPDELERLLALPILAVVPDLEALSGHGYGYDDQPGDRRRGEEAKRRSAEGDTPKIELLPEVRPLSPASEAYRSLRTALLLSTASELKVVSVTSAGAGEGKTATALNLAVVMAQLGRRVLLIDGDLRRARLHRILETSNRLGLVNALTGSTKPTDVMLSTSVPNLRVCPAGPKPPNPSELLASDRWAEFLEVARERFDFVVADSPPVLPVTDAIVLSSLADGVVLCFRAGRVMREEVKSCRDRLELAEIRILGAVLNRHLPAKGGHYARRHSYYEAYVEPADGSAVDSAA